MGSFRDLTGQRFGRWMVLSEAATKNNYVECVCDCGNNRLVFKGTLKNGRSKSCGCLRIDIVEKHGMYQERFYNIWKNMRRRTDSHYATGYKNYGARGIRVCERWQIFKNFKADMYESYIAHASVFGEKNTTIDRKNNDDHYCPDNCRWITRQEQQLNKQDTARYDVRGELLTTREIANKYGLCLETAYYRVKRGWPAERLSTPPHTGNRVVSSCS